MRREVTVWTGGAGAGWSAGTENLAFLDTLVSVADPDELFHRMAEVDGA